MTTNFRSYSFPDSFFDDRDIVLGPTYVSDGTMAVTRMFLEDTWKFESEYTARGAFPQARKVIAYDKPRTVRGFVADNIKRVKDWTRYNVMDVILVDPSSGTNFRIFASMDANIVGVQAKYVDLLDIGSLYRPEGSSPTHPLLDDFKDPAFVVTPTDLSDYEETMDSAIQLFTAYKEKGKWGIKCD